MIRDHAVGSVPPVSDETQSPGPDKPEPAPEPPPPPPPAPQLADDRDEARKDAAAVTITLHAGTGKTTAETLAPVLEETARELTQASAGILKITSSVAVGNDLSGRAGSVPIALWLAGPDAESRTSEVFVFTNKTPDTLRRDVARSLFTIIRNYLAHTASLTVPEATTPETDPMEIMRAHVTRHGWLELGSQLNKTLE